MSILKISKTPFKDLYCLKEESLKKGNILLEPQQLKFKKSYLYPSFYCQIILFLESRLIFHLLCPSAASPFLEIPWQSTWQNATKAERKISNPFATTSKTDPVKGSCTVQASMTIIHSPKKDISWKAKTSCKKGMIIKQDLVDRWHFIQRPTQEGLAPVELMKSQIAENRRPCALPAVLVEKKDGRLGIHVAFASSTLKQQRKCIQDRAKWFCCIDVQSCYLQVWVWDFKKNKDCNDHTLRSLWI